MRHHRPPPIALLLTGGGARAALQIGILKAIAQFYPHNHGIPFSILCGTSAGGINATALACYASCFRLGIKKLHYIWRNFHCEQVYHCAPTKITRQLLGRVLPPHKNPSQGFSLLDSSPLRALLDRVMPYPRIERNIISGYLGALSVTASDYGSGDSISFFQGHAYHSPWQRVKRRSVRTVIQSAHLMATSAIPILFPASKIGQHYYGDGSVHQLSPLSPAIHLGAERILVIGVEQSLSSKPRMHTAPDIANIAGHLLNTIFTDTLNTDMERCHRINDTLSLLPEPTITAQGLKPIGAYRLYNPYDLESIACEHFMDLPYSVRMLLRAFGIKQHTPSSIASYLLFEPAYTQRLIQLGEDQVHQHERSLREFLEI